MNRFCFRGVSPRSLALVVGLLLAHELSACGGEVAGPNRQEVNDQICSRAVELGCAESNQCIDAMNDLRADAAKAGCSTQMDAVLSCFSRNLTSCQVDLEDACPTEAAAYEACEDDAPPLVGEECFVGSNGKDCAVNCETYSAECYVLANSQLECRCASGANQGLFLETNCDELVEVAEACR